jgi:hypothetical protein
MSNDDPKTKQIEPYQWSKGQSGNPKGRPKGSKSLATIIRELEDEEFDWSLLPTSGKPELKVLIEQLKEYGSPFRAIVIRALADSLGGDAKAREWLRKAGYGDRIDVTSKGKEIKAPLIISTIKPRDVETEDEAAESS